MKRVTINVDENWWKELKIEAIREGMSVSGYLMELCKKKSRVADSPLVDSGGVKFPIEGEIELVVKTIPVSAIPARVEKVAELRENITSYFKPMLKGGK